MIRSDGTPERDFLYVDDAVEAYLAIADALDGDGARGEAFNAGGGRAARRARRGRARSAASRAPTSSPTSAASGTPARRDRPPVRRHGEAPRAHRLGSAGRRSRRACAGPWSGTGTHPAGAGALSGRPGSPRARAVLDRLRARPALAAAVVYGLLSVALYAPALVPGHTLSASDYLWTAAPWSSCASARRPGLRLELRARRLGPAVPALAAVLPRPAARRAAVEPAPRGRPALRRQRAVGAAVAVQPALLRPALLVVARGRRRPEGLRRGVRDVPAGAGARAAVRRRAAGGRRLRLQPLLRRLGLVAADRRVGAPALAPARHRAPPAAPRSAAGGRPGRGRRAAVPGRAPGVELPPAARDRRLLRLPAGDAAPRRGRWSGRRAGDRWASRRALAGGAALAAITLLPFLELLRQSDDVDDARRRTGSSRCRASTCSGSRCPTTGGGGRRPRSAPSPRVAPSTSGRCRCCWRASQSCAGRRRCGSERRSWAALMLAVVVGVAPLPQLISHVPLIRTGNHLRLVIVLVLCLALLAGWGLDDVVAGRVRRRGLVLAAGAALLLAPVVVLAGRGDLRATVLGDALRVAWGLRRRARERLRPAHRAGPAPLGAARLAAAHGRGPGARGRPPAGAGSAPRPSRPSPSRSSSSTCSRPGWGRRPRSPSTTRRSRARRPPCATCARSGRTASSAWPGRWARRRSRPTWRCARALRRPELRRARRAPLRPPLAPRGPGRRPDGRSRRTTAVLTAAVAPGAAPAERHGRRPGPGRPAGRAARAAARYDRGPDARIYRLPGALPRAGVVDAQQVVAGRGRRARRRAATRASTGAGRSSPPSRCPGCARRPAPARPASRASCATRPSASSSTPPPAAPSALVLTDVQYPGWTATAGRPGGGPAPGGLGAARGRAATRAPHGRAALRARLVAGRVDRQPAGAARPGRDRRARPARSPTKAVATSASRVSRLTTAPILKVAGR